jgi:YggT family protein
VKSLICNVLQLYVIALFGRVILSWFPISPGTAMASIYRFLLTVTEPVLGPVRRVVPPLGAFDLSPLIVLLVAQFVLNAICPGRGLLG